MVERRPTLAMALTLTALLSGCSSPRSSEPDVDVQVFEGARLITGDGSAPIEDGVMVVRDGTIVHIGPRSSVDVPAGAKTIDLSGKTAMPMLVNVHGHVGYWKGAETDREHFNRENVLDHLQRLVYYGVGAIQSLGTDRDGVEIAIRNEQRAGSLADPELALLFSAANGIVAPTPGEANGGPFFATDVVYETATPEEARENVRAIARAEPDIIKLWVDDRNGTKAKVTPEVYRAVIEEAHAQGLRVIAHVYYLDDAKDLVRAGVDGFAHMVRAEPGIDDELVSLIQERDVFSCTTLSVHRGMAEGSSWLDDPALAETVNPEVIAGWKDRFDRASPETVERSKALYARLEGSLRKLSEAGARIALCGDTGFSSQAPGFTEHRELEAMVRAGMPPLGAIRSATHVGAGILGLDDRGTLAPGMRADFIVLDANPLDDIANTREIAAVYRNGTAVDRAALRERWTGEGTS